MTSYVVDGTVLLTFNVNRTVPPVLQKNTLIFPFVSASIRLKGPRRILMDTDNILSDDIPYGDILSDGLPKILPPYENGIFQSILTLPEAHDALVSIVAAILGRPVKTVMLRNNDAPSRDKLAKREEYDINCVVDAEDGEQFACEMQASPMAGDNRENNHR